MVVGEINPRFIMEDRKPYISVCVRVYRRLHAVFIFWRKFFLLNGTVLGVKVSYYETVNTRGS